MKSDGTNHINSIARAQSVKPPVAVIDFDAHATQKNTDLAQTSKRTTSEFTSKLTLKASLIELLEQLNKVSDENDLDFSNILNATDISLYQEQYAQHVYSEFRQPLNAKHLNSFHYDLFHYCHQVYETNGTSVKTAQKKLRQKKVFHAFFKTLINILSQKDQSETAIIDQLKKHLCSISPIIDGITDHSPYINFSKVNKNCLNTHLFKRILETVSGQTVDDSTIFYLLAQDLFITEMNEQRAFISIQAFVDVADLSVDKLKDILSTIHQQLKSNSFFILDDAHKLLLGNLKKLYRFPDIEIFNQLNAIDDLLRQPQWYLCHNLLFSRAVPRQPLKTRSADTAFVDAKTLMHISEHALTRSCDPKATLNFISSCNQQLNTSFNGFKAFKAKANNAFYAHHKPITSLCVILMILSLSVASLTLLHLMPGLIGLEALIIIGVIALCLAAYTMTNPFIFDGQIISNLQPFIALCIGVATYFIIATLLIGLSLPYTIGLGAVLTCLTALLNQCLQCFMGEQTIKQTPLTPKHCEVRQTLDVHQLTSVFSVTSKETLDINSNSDTFRP